MIALNRRKFVAMTGGAAALTFIQPSFAAPLTFPAGIQLYAVREPLSVDAPATLKALNEIGFREVETAGYGKHTAREFRGFCDDAWLKVPSAHLDFQSAADFGPLFAEANTLGAQYATSSYLRDLSVRRPPVPNTPGQPSSLTSIGLDGFKKMAAHMNEFERTPDGSFGYDVLLHDTDSELVKFEIDCGWMIIAGGNPLSYFKKYPGRFRMLHVKDFKSNNISTDLTGPGRPQGVVLGHGFIDYKPILSAARRIGIQHAFAEQEAPYIRPQLESAKVSFDYLNSLV
jgi:sugar phosphate isomerase/epimerase